MKKQIFFILIMVFLGSTLTACATADPLALRHGNPDGVWYLWNQTS